MVPTAAPDTRRAIGECSGPTVGIDLGTTAARLAVLAAAGPLLLPDAEGALEMPSQVGLLPDGTYLVGHMAHRQAVRNAEHTLDAVAGLHGAARGHGAASRHSSRAAWVASLLLTRLRARAESYLAGPVGAAHIVVPGGSDTVARRTYRTAARLAGFAEVRLVDATRAAALELTAAADGAECAAVVDCGGGTCEVAVLARRAGRWQRLSSRCVMALGGRDFDAALATWLAQAVQREYGSALQHAPPGLRRRLVAAARAARHALSTAAATPVHVPYIAAHAAAAPGHLNLELTRQALEAQTSPLVARIATLCDEARAAAKMPRGAVDAVWLTGQLTQMPALRAAVEHSFGRVASARAAAYPAALGALRAPASGGGQPAALHAVLPQPPDATLRASATGLLFVAGRTQHVGGARLGAVDAAALTAATQALQRALAGHADAPVAAAYRALAGRIDSATATLYAQD